MPSIKTTLQEQIKEALKSRDSKKSGALRLLTAAIKQYEVDKRVEVTDEIAIKLFTKLLKQRQESLVHFEKANRTELIQQEQYEIDLINNFMPQPLSEDELNVLIKKAIEDTNAKEIRDMGKVLSILSKQVMGKADMSKVSAMVKSSLQNN